MKTPAHPPAPEFAGHTPLPWTANRNSIESVLDGDTSTIVGTRNDRQGHANAAMIARAVNNHERLERENARLRAALAGSARSQGVQS